jgi:MinD superfamily P-loop ATPase
VEYCEREGLPVLAVIPDDRSIAESYARGVMPARVHPEFARIIGRLAATVLAGPSAGSWSSGGGGVTQ